MAVPGLPSPLDRPEVIAYLAILTMWQSGDALPPYPKAMKRYSVPGLILLAEEHGATDALILALHGQGVKPDLRKLRRWNRIPRDPIRGRR
jgi:hypothetical protein